MCRQRTKRSGGLTAGFRPLCAAAENQAQANWDQKQDLHHYRGVLVNRSAGKQELKRLMAVFPSSPLLIELNPDHRSMFLYSPTLVLLGIGSVIKFTKGLRGDTSYLLLCISWNNHLVSAKQKEDRMFLKFL